ncbi:hypothetical protein Clacol_000973 [Clathrus columnatus]|uniref:Uncharacterized protein n=1 Tax=Clathrus columnatus TaxID=1419009 RepID=A0AAV5A055_9AGAM|nr:hypothetical protein Clacol_000973 [Clathrus columnatus]
MGGFVITDQEQNPVQVLVLHPSHLRDPYFKDLLPTITKVDDDIRARLKILLTDFFEASVAADSVGSKPKGFADAETVDEIIAILLTVIFKTVSESELLQVLLGHEAVVQLFATNMATEAAKITRTIIEEKCKGEMSDGWTREGFEIWLRAILEDRFRAGLPGRLQVIKKTLEMDIQGRSKHDSLAKTFALAQTTWFIAQCIARRVQHLPLTQIELMACAYATLNAAIYFFWWYKPFRVIYPNMLRSQISPVVRKVDTSTTGFWNIFGQLVGDGVYNGDDFRWRLQMPTFDPGCLYNTGDRQGMENFAAEVLTAVVFGGIHLFAWNYEFPTRVELWFWRVSALIIVVLPPIFLISMFTLFWIPRSMIGIYVYAAFLSYIVARLSILILSIISLRNLPAGTLSNVDWLTFIPHID